MNSKEVASIGGKARAFKLTKERRSEIARHAIQARWKKQGSKNSKYNEKEEYIQQLESERRLMARYVKDKYRIELSDFLNKLQEDLEASID